MHPQRSPICTIGKILCKSCIYQLLVFIQFSISHFSSCLVFVRTESNVLRSCSHLVLKVTVVLVCIQFLFSLLYCQMSHFTALQMSAKCVCSASGTLSLMITIPSGLTCIACLVVALHSSISHCLILLKIKVGQSYLVISGNHCAVKLGHSRAWVITRSYRNGVFFFQILYSSFITRSSTASSKATTNNEYIH